MVRSDRIEVHDYDRDIKRSTDYISSTSDIINENKGHILKFFNHCVAENLSKARQLFYLKYLSYMAKTTKKSFMKMKRDDIEKLLADMNHKESSEWTKQGYRVALKKFYKWLKKTDEGYPQEVRWIKTTVRNANNIVPKVFTTDQLDLMIENAVYTRDKALLSVLGDAGCRIGELLSCKMKHFIINGDNNIRLIIEGGKSGENSILLIRSVPYLLAYLNEHVGRDNPENPLWVDVRKKWRKTGKKDKEGKDVREPIAGIKPLRYGSVRMMIKRVAKKSGIKIRIHPHMFRAFATTQLILKGVPEMLIKKRMGWSPNSKVIGVYQRTTNEDVDTALRKANGLIEEKNITETTPICLRCKTPLRKDAVVCDKCGQVLNLSVAEENETENKIREAFYYFSVFKKLEKKKKLTPEDFEKIAQEIENKGTLDRMVRSR